MLELPDVTLFSIYTIAHELHVKALQDCLSRVKFGSVKLFTDKVIGPEEKFVTEITASTNLSHFHNWEFPEHIQTSHVLAFQWDAWVTTPSMWTDEFLQYDYIGAPWWYQDGLNVGNSGFCLRSKKLIDFLADHRDDFPIIHPEDETLCRHYRKFLPQFKWANDETAFRFSFERVHPNHGSFGFHGVFNWPFVLTNEQIKQRLIDVPEWITNKSEYTELQSLMLTRDS